MATETTSTTLLRQTHDSPPDTASTRLFGFWVYLMSDCILFASLFVSFAVLRGNSAGGPTARQIVTLPVVLAETVCLLSSSFAYGLVTLAMRRGALRQVVTWLALTFLLGASFVALEASEFRRLILDGNGPARSAFLSSFFTLVGTHGLHVSCGLLWMIVLTAQVARKGLGSRVRTRIRTLGLFWHFLDVVWICVFSFVYLAGAA
ncbi:MAG TPA: cytochrome o ubiquinol oxidase subunit III [Spirochaetia bacterium]|nr:cytochrome o ubiquinol oxidase subunit III [Spirochaetia bacterium]